MQKGNPNPISPAALPSLEQETNLLERFERDVELAGLVGEKKNASTLFLCAVSARLPNPISVNVNGASSAGKNYLLSRVASFIPDEHKKFLTGMSEKALMHAKEDEYHHKAVFIAEYEGVRTADYAIRTFQSEQFIEWTFAEAGASGIRNKTNRVKGPAAFIQATTRSLLHPENETRLLFIQMDETQELTAAILERQAQEAENGTKPPATFEAWHRLLRSLNGTQVVIPYATKLAPYFPTGRIRSRRDFPKLLELIRASAYLNQNVRQVAGNIIRANAEDYRVAKQLFEHSYYAGPDEAINQFLKAAQARSGVSTTNGSDVFTVPQIQNDLGWRHTKTYEVLHRCRELGFVTDGERRGYYRFVRLATGCALNLPESVGDE